jgi:hypothetical protein
MTVTVFENLDLTCAKAGKEIAGENPTKELENLVRDALAVLEEQGVYALFLYLESSKRDEKISEKLHEFMKQTPQQKTLIDKNSDNILDSIRNDLAINLDKLLLAKDLLCQTLVYARWHARLRDDEAKQQHEDKEESGGAK